MIRLTPVTDSNARMLRPSRPMIRPFISSPGRCSTLTTLSAVCSLATRWMASTTTARARVSAVARASFSMSRTRSAASRLACASIVSISSVRAASAVSPAMRSSSRRCRSTAVASSASRPVERRLAVRPVRPRRRTIRRSRSARRSASWVEQALPLVQADLPALGVGGLLLGHRGQRGATRARRRAGPRYGSVRRRCRPAGAPARECRSPPPGRRRGSGGPRPGLRWPRPSRRRRRTWRPRPGPAPRRRTHRRGPAPDGAPSPAEPRAAAPGEACARSRRIHRRRRRREAGRQRPGPSRATPRPSSRRAPLNSDATAFTGVVGPPRTTGSTGGPAGCRLSRATPTHGAPGGTS